MTVAVVAGALANKAGNAGEAWVRMSWAEGLRRMGFEVLFVEEIDPRTCTDESGAPVAPEFSRQRAWFDAVTADFGFTGSAALVCGGSVAGMARAELVERLHQAALLVNVSGTLRDPELLSLARRRVFVDLDPGFTQAWHAAGDAGAALAHHDDFFTVGELVGTGACPVPTGGMAWRPVRQPVVLDHWPVSDAPPARGFTTVATWRPPFSAAGPDGRPAPGKHHEFRRVMALPAEVAAPLELALAIDPADDADLLSLQANGWHVVDARRVAGTPAAFRSYVAGSLAELSCAQGLYVETRSGWLSDRTARYLASGRPAVVQDTGFADVVPAGEGLLAFSDLTGAAAAARSVLEDYERHAKAARALAEEYFAAEVVLGRFLEDLDVAP